MQRGSVEVENRMSELWGVWTAGLDTGLVPMTGCRIGSHVWMQVCSCKSEPRLTGLARAYHTVNTHFSLLTTLESRNSKSLLFLVSPRVPPS